MKLASVPTFIQNSRIYRTIFQIRGHDLAISVIRPDAGFDEYLVDLRTVDPDYQPRAVRLHRLVIIPGVMAVLSGFVIWGLMRLTFIPHEALSYFFQWPAIVFAVSLALAIRGSRRVEYYQFHDHWKKPAFEIICEREQKDECAVFISALVAHIELAQSTVSAADQSKIIAGMDSLVEHPHVQAPTANRWKFSIGLGAFAAGIPLLPNAGLDVDPSVFIIIFPLCLGGVACSYFSFNAREPNRWWSLIGAVLSLIPSYFY